MTELKEFDFTQKRALIRVDFNVPLDDFQNITDATRIKAALPTIRFVLKQGGSVVLMSHLGRPKDGPDSKFSLQPVALVLEDLLKIPVIFIDDCIGDEALKITQSMPVGTVVLLENLRFYPQEKKGDIAFAQRLSMYGDIYINDAFGTAHRAHASTAKIAQFFPDKKCYGQLLANEIKNIDKVLHHSKAPKLAIVGGAKVSSKIGIIDQLMDVVDELIIGGGMAYTFIKAQGGSVGNSLVEDDYLSTALAILNKAKEKGVQIYLPIDTVIADEFANEAHQKIVEIKAIPSGWMGLDIGPQSIRGFKQQITQAKTILWNGPMGVFEMDNFSKGTKAVANAIVDSTKNGAFSLVGGGDSVAALNSLHLAGSVSYVSTGGGAMLAYLEGKVLPGIKAIKL